jgi:hypothetical protein
MKDTLNTLKGRLYGLGIVDVTLDELDLVSYFVKVMKVPGAQVVQDPDAVACLE